MSLSIDSKSVCSEAALSSSGRVEDSGQLKGVREKIFSIALPILKGLGDIFSALLSGMRLLLECGGAFFLSELKIEGAVRLFLAEGARPIGFYTGFLGIIFSVYRCFEEIKRREGVESYIGRLSRPACEPFAEEDSSAKSVEKILTMRKRGEMERASALVASLKESGALQALFRGEISDFEAGKESLSGFGIELSSIPLSGDGQSARFWEINSRLKAIEEAVSTEGGLSAEELPALLKEHTALVEELKALPIAHPPTSLEEVKALLQEGEKAELLLFSAARRRASSAETLSLLLRNGLQATAKGKALEERKLFQFNLVETAVMAPLNLLLSTATVAAFALLTFGVVATLPLWLSPLGYAVIGLGLLFAIAKLFYEIRHRPRQLYENVVKLRFFKAKFWELLYKFNLFRLKRGASSMEEGELAKIRAEAAGFRAKWRRESDLINRAAIEDAVYGGFVVEELFTGKGVRQERRELEENFLNSSEKRSPTAAEALALLRSEGGIGDGLQKFLKRDMGIDLEEMEKSGMVDDWQSEFKSSLQEFFGGGIETLAALAKEG